MLILSNDDIEKILPVGTCLDVLEEAYRDLGNGARARPGSGVRFRPNGFWRMCIPK